jgi:hypothetical protein
MGTSQIWGVPYSLVSKDVEGPIAKLGITGTTTNMEEALFEVKNQAGKTVFAVYNEGIRAYVGNGDTKGKKGGFSVGGYDATKGAPYDLFVLNTDSARFYIDSKPNLKGKRGGFSVGGYDMTKAGIPVHDYLDVSKDSVRIYVDSNPLTKGKKGGFSIGGYDMTKGGIPAQDYMHVSKDSVRVYVDSNPATKGVRGGFAVGGYDLTKGGVTINKFLAVNPDSTRIFTTDAKKGFGVGNLSAGVAENYLKLTPDNYFIGHEAGMLNTTGSYNSFFGYNAGRSNTSGSWNTFIGHKSGYSNKDGEANLFVGDSAGYQNTSGYANVFLGPWAGQENTTGYYNVFLGYIAGAFSTEGWQNTSIGAGAGLYNTTGNRNISLGAAAGRMNTTGSMNVFVGNFAGGSCTTGETNVYLGAYAGRYDITGHRNVFLGYSAGMNETSSNKLYIASNPLKPLLYGDLLYQKLTIAGDSTSNTFNRTFFVNGDAGGKYAWSNDSDKKLKHDIITIPDALQKVLKLRGVNFLWNEPKEGMAGLQMGFIGQEAVDIVPEVVSVSNDHYSMQYAPITSLLVEAMKEQQHQIESAKQENQYLRSELDELKSLVNSLIANQTAQMNK